MHFSNKSGLYLCVAAVALSLTLSACDSASLDDTPAGLTADVDELQHGDIIPGQYIVVVDEERAGKAPELVVDDLLRKRNVEVLHRYGSAIHGFAAKMTEEEAAELSRDERLKFVEPDRMIILAPCKRFPDHPDCGGDVGDPEPGGQETPWGVTRVGGASDGTGMTAWVIDTGIDLDHPDLVVDASKGFNAFSSGRDGRSLDDGHGHGTHVAGTIAAIDNSTGVVGVAAGATVIPVKVLSSRGSGSTSGVIAGVNHVAANGRGDVANMSLGGGVSASLDQAVVNAAKAGVTFALAAGNDGGDANNHSPARVEHSGVYTVAAVGQNNCLASWSNYGVPPVETAAPGVGILSLKKGGGTTTMSGTSMAAPHVAGILLLGQLGSDGTACESRPGSYPIAHK